jgi:hypothetical protein
MNIHAAYGALERLLVVKPRVFVPLNCAEAQGFSMLTPVIGHKKWWHPVRWSPKIEGVFDRRLTIEEFLNMVYVHDGKVRGALDEIKNPIHLVGGEPAGKYLHGDIPVLRELADSGSSGDQQLT